MGGDEDREEEEEDDDEDEDEEEEEKNENGDALWRGDFEAGCGDGEVGLGPRTTAQGTGDDAVNSVLDKLGS